MYEESGEHRTCLSTPASHPARPRLVPCPVWTPGARRLICARVRGVAACAVVRPERWDGSLPALFLASGSHVSPLTSHGLCMVSCRSWARTPRSAAAAGANFCA